VFVRLKAFGGYSFPKSHAAAFAVLVYQSAWLKRYHPAAFYAALLNHQPMGFWSPAVIVNDAKRHGIAVLPVDILKSEARCSLEDGNLRLGFNYVKGAGEASAARIVEERFSAPFRHVADFCRRTRLPPRLVEHLIMAGAFDRWQIPRRKLLWELGKLRYQVEELDLIFPDDGVILPELSEGDKQVLERSLLGVSTNGHVLDFYRAWLEQHGFLSSADLRQCQNGDLVRVGGWVVVHQAPPSAKGFHFVTLEDEYGLFDIIVRPDIYEHYRRILHQGGLLLVAGVMQRRDEVLNVIAQQVASGDLVSRASE
jgi:error-prone DNA polymerase